MRDKIKPKNDDVGQNEVSGDTDSFTMYAKDSDVTIIRSKFGLRITTGGTTLRDLLPELKLTDEEFLSGLSGDLKEKFELIAKAKFGNDPYAIKKALSEAKDSWLTQQRMNQFKQETIVRKLDESIIISPPSYGNDPESLSFTCVAIEKSQNNVLSNDKSKLKWTTILYGNNSTADEKESI